MKDAEESRELVCSHLDQGLLYTSRYRFKISILESQ